jgi:hypothetical protein
MRFGNKPCVLYSVGKRSLSGKVFSRPSFIFACTHQNKKFDKCVVRTHREVHTTVAPYNSVLQ